MLDFIKIDVERLLDDIGIQYEDSGDDWRCKCWYHAETKPSLFIDKEKGFFHCFSCNRSGNIFTILWDILNISGMNAMQYLSNFTKGGLTDEDIRQHIINSMNKRKPELPKRKTLNIELPENILLKDINILEDSYNYELVKKAYDYLLQRGMTDSDISLYNIGVITGYPYKGYILIPIYFRNILRTYFLRSVDNNRKLYGKHERSDIIFGLDLAPDRDKELAISEGIFDSLIIKKLGVQSGSALSNRILPSQLLRLKEYKEIVLFPDNDENQAGLYLIDSVKDLIYNTYISVAFLPHNIKDPGECFNDLDILKQAYLNRVPISKVLSSDMYKKWVFEKNNKKSTYR